MGKFFIWGLVIAALIVVLIYRKKIFQSVKPSLDQLKDAIASGDAGMAPTTPAAAGSFAAGTDGEKISNMIKEVTSKYNVQDLEGADWNSVKAQSSPEMFDNLNLTSRPATVNDILSNNAMASTTLKKDSDVAIVDIGKIVRNQVVINDLWGRRGHPDGCNCGCQVGASLSFFVGLN